MAEKFSDECRRACPYATALLELPLPKHYVPWLAEIRAFAQLQIVRWEQTQLNPQRGAS